MQGRLVNSPYKKIQCFPARDWKKELKIANENDLCLIEWTVNLVNLKKNPIFFKKRLNEIIYFKKRYNCKINSLTCDYFMEKPFFKAKSFEKKKIIFNLKKIIQHSELLNIKYVVMPLVDKSSIKNIEEEIKVVKLFKEIIKKFSKINILFETDYDPKKIIDFMKNFKSKRIGINYDIGNSSSLGYDFDEEKKYYHFIKNVHIKDRKFKGDTVRLGYGSADLEKILRYFKKKKYRGNFILQTARSKNNRHLEELLINLKYIYNLKI